MSQTNTARWKRWLWTLVRVAVCVVALGWVLNNVTYDDYVHLADGTRRRGEGLTATEREVSFVSADGVRRSLPVDAVARNPDGTLNLQYGLGTTWRSADKNLLLLALLVFAPVTLLQSWRFQLMLRAQEIEISYWESVKLSYAGNFLNFIAALGSTGGDVFKMYYVSLHTERKTEAVTTVLLDRVVGLLGLVLIVGVAILVRLGDPKLQVLAYGVGILLAGAILGGVFLFSPRIRTWIRPQELLGKLPFATHWQRAERATQRLAHHKRLLLASLACTVVLQAVAMTSFVLVALALGMASTRSALWDYYAYLAAGMVVAAIPISFQGLGTMEAFYKHALFGTHGSLAALLCLAMIVRLVMFVWALPGALVTITGSYRPRLNDEEIQFA